MHNVLFRGYRQANPGPENPFCRNQWQNLSLKGMMVRIACELEKYTIFHLDKLCIIERLGHCKGGNFNIYIRAWFGYFICSRREIRFYLFGNLELIVV